MPSAPPFGRARMANDVGAVSTFSPACSDEPWGVWSFGPTDNPAPFGSLFPRALIRPLVGVSAQRVHRRNWSLGFRLGSDPVFIGTHG